MLTQRGYGLTRDFGGGERLEHACGLHELVERLSVGGGFHGGGIGSLDDRLLGGLFGRCLGGGCGSLGLGSGSFFGLGLGGSSGYGSGLGGGSLGGCFFCRFSGNSGRGGLRCCLDG